MMLIFVTNEQNAGLFSGVKLNNIFVKAVTDNPDVKRLVINNTTNLAHGDYFAVDLSAVKNSDDEIIEALQAYESMYQGKVIVIAVGKPTDEPIVMRLREAGFRNIVFDITQESVSAALSEQPYLPKETTAEPRAAPQTIVREIIKEVPVPQVVIKRLKQHVTVSLCGSQSRVGATTQALMMAKFLCNMGGKVCYAELSKNSHVRALAKVYQMNENTERGFVQMDGVDLFYKYDLGYIVSCGYEFIILDWGVFDGGFTQNFITSDVKVVVAGTKAWEMQYLSGIFEKVGELDDINFIFTFTPTDEQSYISDMMGKFKDRTYFAEYTPALMEHGGNVTAYERIFGEFLLRESPPPIETAADDDKGGLFGRLFKK